jgi:uncharacterized membrane protein
MVGSRNDAGTALARTIKTTVAGGLLFLLPLVLVVILLSHALRLAGTVAKPITDALQVEAMVGRGGEEVLAIALLVAVSIAAGQFARTAMGRNLKRWAEGTFLGGLPQYQLVKSMAEGLAQVEGADGARPALINIEEAWQLGYVLESLGNGWVAVFLPQAPTPLSGSAMYLPEERVRPLAITMAHAMTIVKRMGIGSGEALGDADFTLPNRVA